MGVHGLWELLAPVGRRVSVETLAGKKLAIDASIWMVQFMKAMRDEKGEMVRNAHLLGFFRRICKLLFLRAKPVFVFDGSTPALKRRTLASRRRHRDAARAKIRKTAEKLLLSHLKARKLEELAAEIKNSRRDHDNNTKGKQVEASVSVSADQEKLDELLAASLAAEEERGFPDEAGASAPPEDEMEDEEEEMIFPVSENNIDPAVLASLPPSMQLDLLVQMRERVMAENRQKYQKIKKAPAKFSELQIQSYLKTVAFRREIDQVQRCAAGTGLGGVQPSKIASESNREFIFSSSFTGDKQTLVRTAGNNGDVECNTVKNKKSSDILSHSIASSSKSDEFVGNFGSDVETYRDERGCVRVSRVRALGIRMTRDIQRNLDFMKEYEQEKNKRGDNTEDNQQVSALEKGLINSNNSGTKTIEISFLEDQNVGNDSIDQVFMDLVSGDSSNLLFSDNKTDLDKETEQSDEADSIWEEGVIKDTIQTPKSDQNENGNNDVDWEEGISVIPQASATEEEGISVIPQASATEEEGISIILQASATKEEGISMIPQASATEEGISVIPQASATEEGISVIPQASATEFEPKKVLSKGMLEEESLIQEAIRRSLVDLERQKSANTKSEIKITEKSSDLQIDSNERDLSRTIKQTSLAIQDAPNIICSPNESTVVSYKTEVIEGGKDAKQKQVRDSLSESKLPESEPNIESSQPKDNLTDKISNEDVCISNLSRDVIQTEESFSLMDDQYGVSEASLEREISELRQEQSDLGDQRRKLESHAESVSNEMFAECQELLQMFGLPYIIAPMEAEAQCAFMEMNNLVDGVVTDDSDVFLFGARSVYKNIFDDRKYVETYLMKDIESELGLSREQLIRMAMLLGSDYTEGISGIGIVNAIEVVHAFPEQDGLKKFREWIESPDPSILENFNSHSGVKSNNKGSSSGNDDIKEIFMSKHRNVSKNWHLPPSFPSESVISAYMSPQVDDSTETFSWGKPDLNLLRKICWEKFGWNNQKADDLLLPVLKEYNKHETQLRLEAFYTFNERFAKIRSQRIKKAIKGITGSLPSSEDPSVEEPSSSSKKRRQPASKSSRGRGRKTGGYKEKLDHDSPCSTSSEDFAQMSDDRPELRRSLRQRKEVKYTEEGNESIEPEDHLKHTDANGLGLNPAVFAAEWELLKVKDVHNDNLQNPGVSSEKDNEKCDDDEYLFSGGFCVEENDGKGNNSIELESMGEIIGFSNNDQRNDSTVLNADDSSCLEGSRLSAMPLLKRRRARN